ncbi:MAG: DUF4124 domain-containing protein [Pseudomonadota bacterium]
MNFSRFSGPLACAALTAFACAFVGPAHAQWQWLDKDGRKVFSDRSPPTDVKDKDILKRPAGQAKTAAPAPAPATAAVPTPTPAVAVPEAPKVTGKDPQLEARKKQAEDEEAGRKKAEAEKVARAKAENCERARKFATTLDSGVRISTTNAKGEREVLDDKARAVETKRTQDVIASDCT